ncbi:MAG: hypothetical protein HGB00_09375 [Chlorobiaceae bacterium]|nr:hypothetical protein [Chlorobiaceae bacterium]
MRFRMFRFASVAAAMAFQSFQPDALAWHDKTHLSVAETAGFDLWYNAAAPDVAKSKSAFSARESPNHYFNNNDNRKVDAAAVWAQVARYDTPGDAQGHLYGAIIGAVKDYHTMKAEGKYARYPLVFCAHYVGDLSMPLHNTVYDDFNKNRHSANDGVVEGSVRDNMERIKANMTDVVIKNDTDLAREIAVVAESARILGLKIRKENRDMTADEAYLQLGRSASLFRGILVYTQRDPSENGLRPE